MTQRFSILLVAVLATASMVSAQTVVNTKHDLSSSGPGATTNVGRVCVFCHTPHQAAAAGNRTFVSLGDLVSEQVVEVVLRLSFPFGLVGRETGAIVALADRDGVFGPGGMGAAEAARLTWTYADDRANDEQPRDRDVDRAVAHLFAARARQEAVQRNRVGDYAGARHILDATAARIREYAGSDPELRSLVDALIQEEVVLAAPMAEPSRKRMYAASANLMRSRDASGRSVKRA